MRHFFGTWRLANGIQILQTAHTFDKIKHTFWLIQSDKNVGKIKEQMLFDLRSKSGFNQLFLYK